MSYARRLALLIAAGVTIRLVVTFTTDGVAFDLRNLQAVYDALRGARFGAYDHLEPPQWPYGPGYMPWTVVAGQLDGLIPFRRGVRLGPVMADAGTMWLVQDLLRRAGASEGRRLLGVALIAFGSIPIGVSAFHGQLDPVLALCALTAFWVWSRPEQPRRALWAGVLLGVGGAVKTIPLLLALPFAAAARDRREGATVLVATAATFWLLLAPFLVHTPDVVERMRDYHGLPGFGGLGLVLNPAFAANVISNTPQTPDMDFLLFVAMDLPKLVLVPALVALTALLAWRRPDALTGACLTLLVVYAFGVNFVVSYVIWILPFLVVRGHFAAVAGIQLLLTGAMLATFNAPVSHTVAVVFYTGAMIVAWCAAIGTVGGWSWRLARG